MSAVYWHRSSMGFHIEAHVRVGRTVSRNPFVDMARSARVNLRCRAGTFDAFSGQGLMDEASCHRHFLPEVSLAPKGSPGDVGLGMAALCRFTPGLQRFRSGRVQLSPVARVARCWLSRVRGAFGLSDAAALFCHLQLHLHSTVHFVFLFSFSSQGLGPHRFHR
jgi:hypothetical protein